jgi:hypothetical protein
MVGLSTTQQAFFNSNREKSPLRAEDAQRVISKGPDPDNRVGHNSESNQ